MNKSNRIEYWTDHWNKRATTPGKYSHGRGSFPEDVYNSIPIDIINLLEIKSNDTVADIGGATGDYSKYIIQTCNPKHLCLFDSSLNSIKHFQDWAKENNFQNVEAQHCILPEIKSNIKFTKIIIGSVFQYLNSIEDIEKSLQNIYNLLEDNGQVLLFHHYDKEKWIPNEWDLLLINYNELKHISENVGFKEVKRVKVGLYYGNNVCGDAELSVLLNK